MPEAMTNRPEQKSRKTVFGYIAILALGLIAVNVSAKVYGQNVTDIYSAAVTSSR